MTRVNTVPAEWLTDQHLLAELREIPRILAQCRPLAPHETVPSYRLGRGHVLFFYPLTGYVVRRLEALGVEARSRGFRVAPQAVGRSPVPGLDGDWTPGPGAVRLNLERLQERFGARVGWYRYRGAVAGEGHYLKYF